MNDVKHQVAKHPVFISASDIVAPHIRLIIERVGFEKFLYMIGFDNTIDITIDGYTGDEEYKYNPHEDNQTTVGNFYQTDFVTHRNRSGDIVTCDRYVGWERTDKEWINSGNASEMAKLLAKNDPSLLQELKSLGG